MTNIKGTKQQYEADIEARLGRTYYGATDAVLIAASLDGEPGCENGVIITRGRDKDGEEAYTLEPADVSERIANVTKHDDGTLETDFADYSYNEGEYRVMDGMSVRYWDRLTPVSRFLHGESDKVLVHAIPATTFDDDGEPLPDEDVWVMTAENEWTD